VYALILKNNEKKKSFVTLKNENSF